VLSQLGTEKKVTVVYVNIDLKTSDLYKKYGKFYPGGGIPHAVILDSGDRQLGQIEGYLDYPALAQQYEAAIKSKPASEGGKPGAPSGY
jgi:hypothetical protein